jgi:hypothetical protein
MSASRSSARELTFEVVEPVEFSFDLLAVALDGLNLGVDPVGVDRPHDDLTEVIIPCNCAACLIEL